MFATVTALLSLTSLAGMATTAYAADGDNGDTGTTSASVPGVTGGPGVNVTVVHAGRDAFLGSGNTGGPSSPDVTPGPAAPGVSGYEVVTQADVPIDPNGSSAATVQCPAGKNVIGGGFTSNLPALYAFSSGPTSANTSWQVFMHNTANVPASYSAYALCADVAS
ncbi:hypothetical protein ABZ446_26550 [Streptomyces sp. NPDC005813]|uniref:hypothetical protein n=1 Tax=Streptomyces sp. NPDC005813 TaxID=3155592 RepID=UPI0033CB82FA